MKIAIILLILFAGIFIGVGLVFQLPINDIISTGNYTTGIVIDNEINTNSDKGTTYAPIIQYTCDKQTVVSKSQISSSTRYDEGTILNIYFSSNCSNIVIDSFTDKYFGYIFIGVGGLTLLALIIVIFFAIKRAVLLKNLKQSGRRVYTKVSFIGENTHIKINNKHPIIIKSTYKNEFNGEPIEFKSDNIWKDISGLIKVGDTISVLVQGTNYKKYRMDTDFLVKDKS